MLLSEPYQFHYVPAPHIPGIISPPNLSLDHTQNLITNQSIDNGQIVLVAQQSMGLDSQQIGVSRSLGAV